MKFLFLDNFFNLMYFAVSSFLITDFKYGILGILVLISFCISLGLFFLIFVAGFRATDVQKLAPYECGFEVFEDLLIQFNVRFYLLGILFIIFDLELIFIFPWIVILQDFGFFSFFILLFFILIFILGFVYEWQSGALDWD